MNEDGPSYKEIINTTTIIIMDFKRYATLTGIGLDIPELQVRYLVPIEHKNFSITEIRKLADALGCFLCYTITRDKIVHSVFKFRPVEDHGLLKIVSGTNVDRINLFSAPDNLHQVTRAEIHYTDGKVDLAIPDSFEIPNV